LEGFCFSGFNPTFVDFEMDSYINGGISSDRARSYDSNGTLFGRIAQTVISSYKRSATALHVLHEVAIYRNLRNVGAIPTLQ